MKRLTVLDWKSARNVSDPQFEGYPEHPIQVAAYAAAYNLTAEEKVTAAGVVYLDKESGEPRCFDATEELKENFAAFKAVREYFRLKVEPEKSDRRFYKYEGDKFPSVTTILSVLNKPALIQWAANMAADYIADNINELRISTITDERVNQIFTDAKKSHRVESRKAMDIGSVIHDAIQCHLSGGDPSKNLEGNDAARNGFLAFLEWSKRVMLEPVKLEHTVYHPALRYAGTFDFLGYVDFNGASEQEELLDF